MAILQKRQSDLFYQETFCSQLRRLTFSSRFEEGERVEITPDDPESTEGSDEEMGMATSTLPLKEKTVDGAETQEESEEDTETDEESEYSTKQLIDVKRNQ